MKKKPTKAQEWQRKRYQAKGSLTSARNRFSNLLKAEFLSYVEKLYIEKILFDLNQMLDEWKMSDKHSKHRYLNEHKND